MVDIQELCMIITLLLTIIPNRIYYNRYGSPNVEEDVVDPDIVDPLEYTIIGLDPHNPDAEIHPQQNPFPAAYSVWVVAVYDEDFVPPQSDRKKREVVGDLGLEEETYIVESEPAVLSYEDGITGKSLTLTFSVAVNNCNL